jgi:hypothetical protein
VDKVLNSYLYNRQVRISWINELSEYKLDDAVLKKFCDGEITTTQLFKDGCTSIRHISKPIFTANTMPNIKMDSGTLRRIVSYMHYSNFTADKTLLNDKENIYLLDKSLLKKLINENLLNAWFDILARRGHDYLNGEVPEFNKNFSETKDSVIASNDKIQDFIDEFLILTKDQNIRIGKKDMYLKFRAENPKSLMTDSQILTCLKSKGLKYNSLLRGNDKTQGCYIGVRFSDEQNLNTRESELMNEKDILMLKIKELEDILKQHKIIKLEDDKKNNDENIFEEKELITFSKSKPKETHNNKSQFLEELDDEDHFKNLKSKFN